MSFTAEQLAYLRSQWLGRLATVRPDGSPQVSPVGFGVNLGRGTIDIGGRDMASSQKFRNVAATGRAAFVVDDVPSTSPLVVRCLEVRGRAEALEAAGDSAANIPGPFIRIHPERVIAWGM